MRAVAACAVMCLALALPAEAQPPIGVRACSNPARVVPAPPPASIRRVSAQVEEGCDRSDAAPLRPSLDLRAELLAMDRYAQWGMMIGTAAGVGYALATTSGDSWSGLTTIIDGTVGFTIGVTAGMLVYVGRRASGQLPAPAVP